jgi:hypothetical protein
MPSLEGCDCPVAVQLKPRSAGTPTAVSDRQDTWLPLYRARSGHVHGSGGRHRNLAIFSIYLLVLSRRHRSWSRSFRVSSGSWGRTADRRSCPDLLFRSSLCAFGSVQIGP